MTEANFRTSSGLFSNKNKHHLFQYRLRSDVGQQKTRYSSSDNTPS